MGWTRAQVVNVAKRTGYPVVEAWSGHNRGLMGTVYGPMLHHTGTSAKAAGDYPTLRIVRDGRPGLENSLSMYGLGRSGTIYCISEKVSWHSGAGNWNGVTDGNGHFAGIEAESSGGGEWTAAQVDSYQKLTASILLETGRGLDWMPRHADWALPRGRKSDAAGIDMAAFKKKVATYLANPSLLGVKGSVEDDMYDANARQELIGERIDKTIIPLLNNIKENAIANRPFVLYRLDNSKEQGHGAIYLAGEGMWWHVPNSDYVILVQTYGLAGEVKNVASTGQLDFIKLMWSLKAPVAKVDTDAIVAKLNASAAKITPADIAAIAKAANDEDDRRDRDNDPKTGATS